MGSDIVELIKDIVKYLSSGLVEYFLECRVSDKRQEYFEGVKILVSMESKSF